MRRCALLVYSSLCISLLVSGQAHGQQKADRTAKQSCRKFVQSFYDWYVRATQNTGYEAAVKRRRSAFSPELLRRLNEDLAAQKKVPGEIVGLDFDPFLNAQDIAPKYTVGKVHQKGDRYLVQVFGIWSGKKGEIPSVEPELKRADGRWVFLNFHYHTDKKNPANENLLNVLKSLREERKKAHKPAERKGSGADK